MNRRAFVTGLGAVLGAPLAVEAQQATGSATGSDFLTEPQRDKPRPRSAKVCTPLATPRGLTS
jgi:hypothetical protein